MSNLNLHIDKPKKGNEIIVKPFALKMLGADFKMDHKPRRKNNSPHRRALVHDFKDGLTINYAKDYPGGVTLSGPIKCTDSLKVKGHDLLSLVLKMEKKINLLESRLKEIEWD